MSSVQSAYSQISHNSSQLISVVAGLFYQDLTGTLLDTFVVGTTTGLVSKNGGKVIFSTPANVTTALGAAATGAVAGNQATTAGEIFRDLGKTITVYTLANGVAVPYAIFTRVRNVKGDLTSNSTEGDNGRLGFVVTKSSVDGVASVDVSVARTGAGYGSTF